MCAYPTLQNSNHIQHHCIEPNIREDIVKSATRYALFLLVLFPLLLGVTACGGGSGGSTSGGGGGGGGGNGGGGGAVGQATIISVSGGQTTTGVDIAVASPASSPTPN